MAVCTEPIVKHFTASLTADGTLPFSSPTNAGAGAGAHGQGGNVEQVVGPLVDATVRVLGAFYPYLLLLAAFVWVLVLTLRATHPDAGVREGAHDMLRVITGRAFMSALTHLIHGSELGSGPADVPTPDNPSQPSDVPTAPDTPPE